MKTINNKITVGFHDKIVGTLSLTPDNRLCSFEYSQEWLIEGFSISPLELPLKPGIFIAKPTPFYGNFGIFEDSLPDGYGRYLLHKVLMKEGIDDSQLSVLDRLSLVGSNAMGALTYIPTRDLVLDDNITDFDLLQEKALEVLREKQDADACMLLQNSGNSGGARPKAVFSDNEGHWLIKFRHTYDPTDIGVTEFRYNEAAKRCGICVPDFRLINNRYFASRRFDIDGDGQRIHVATAGSLLGISLATPVLDYRNLLALTGYLTQNPAEIEEMYRRMIFNYLTDNKDDHCKNFSFMVERTNGGKWLWKLAPAYDLTLCTEGYNGEHATSVNGTGRPSLSDFLAVGKRIRMSEKRCLELIGEVRDGVNDIAKYEIR